MPTEIEELQTLLAAIAPPGTRTFPSPQRGGQSPKAVIEDVEDTQSVDFCQWQVFPNGVYRASGGTQERLPTGAYTISVTQAGLFFNRKRMLTDTLIDLGNSNSLHVIEGIKLFWTRKEHYQRKGVLYKRGILMWGPPGSGKTATLAILVEMLVELGGIVLLVQNPGTAVAGLDQLRKIEPERPLIVVLEDVEEIISSFGEHDLLALLDGEHQTDNVVNIATTNYPEQLGARIINRPSCFDEVIKIGMPSEEMREQYLWHVLGDDVEKYPVAKWVDKTAGMSIAHLKELVIAVTCLGLIPFIKGMLRRCCVFLALLLAFGFSSLSIVRAHESGEHTQLLQGDRQFLRVNGRGISLQVQRTNVNNFGRFISNSSIKSWTVSHADNSSGFQQTNRNIRLVDMQYQLARKIAIWFGKKSVSQFGAIFFHSGCGATDSLPVGCYILNFQGKQFAPSLQQSSGGLSDVLQSSLYADANITSGCGERGSEFQINTDPRSFCHLKLLLSGLPLIAANEGIDDDCQDTDHFGCRFPPWRVTALAIFGFVVSWWGWHNIRNNRRLVWGTCAFVGGLILWAIAVQWFLHWFALTPLFLFRRDVTVIMQLLYQR